MTFIEKIKAFCKKILDYLFIDDYSCIICRKELDDEHRHYALCDDCSARLPFKAEGNKCNICGDYIEQGVYCKRCQVAAPYYDKAYAPFDYVDDIRKIIIHYKDRKQSYLGKYITRFLVDYSYVVCIKCDAVAYVPSDKKSIKRRGFDHMQAVAKRFCDERELPLIDVISRKIKIKDQTKLKYEERVNAVKDAFELKDGVDVTELQGKTILLLDDVLTTGATASAIAKIFKEAGVHEVIVLTLAR